jgi:hypothetical protein
MISKKLMKLLINSLNKEGRVDVFYVDNGLDFYIVSRNNFYYNITLSENIQENIEFVKKLLHILYLHDRMLVIRTTKYTYDKIYRNNYYIYRNFIIKTNSDNNNKKYIIKTKKGYDTFVVKNFKETSDFILNLYSKLFIFEEFSTIIINKKYTENLDKLFNLISITESLLYHNDSIKECKAYLKNELKYHKNKLMDNNTLITIRNIIRAILDKDYTSFLLNYSLMKSKL